jgi:hypothetical protein
MKSSSSFPAVVSSRSLLTADHFMPPESNVSNLQQGISSDDQ